MARLCNSALGKDRVALGEDREGRRKETFMSKFHSVVSRRDFMKGLGLAGAGLGAISAATPAFHDLDELIAAPSASPKRPWYVKENDFYKPTMEVDWDVTQRFDRNLRKGAKDIFGAERYADAQAAGKAVQRSINEPGFTLKDQLLSESYMRPSYSASFAEMSGVSLVKSPEERGVPRWSGSPEEASRMLQSAARAFGGAFVGIAKLDSTWRNKVIVKSTSSGDIVYEDVDHGYEVSKVKQVIPNKDMWAIIMTSPEPFGTSKGRPATVRAGNGRNLHKMLHASLHQFLHGLGYQMLGNTGHQQDIHINGQAMVLTGLSEASRHSYYTLSPEYGTLLNPESAVTDLPLAPTKPIDAGMWKFCETCAKCAQYCPSQSISLEKHPSWDVTTAVVNGVETNQHNPGKKAFWLNIQGCSMYRTEVGNGCWFCYGTCTFAEGQEAMVHQMVKVAISTTGLFNGFFANMSDVFGYGLRDPADWWERSQPILGFDSTAVVA